MKVLLKIAITPVAAVLQLIIWICSAVLHGSAFLFGLAGTLIGILGLAVMLTYSTRNGLILMAIAFLVSPLGIPMAAVWALRKAQDLQSFITSRVFR